MVDKLYWVKNDKHLWWSATKRKWMPSSYLGKNKETLSCTREFVNRKAAFNHAGNMGVGFYIVVLERAEDDKGWYTEEYYVKEGVEV